MRHELAADQANRVRQQSERAEEIECLEIQLTALRRERRDAHGDELSLRAPCRGHVLRRHLQGPGSLVREGDVLAEVSCNDAPLEALLSLPQVDVALLWEGQGVKLLYDALPHERYGVRHARLRWVSPASVEVEGRPVFRALASLASGRDSVDGRDVARCRSPDARRADPIRRAAPTHEATTHARVDEEEEMDRYEIEVTVSANETEVVPVELEAVEHVTGGWSFGSWSSLLSGFSLSSGGIEVLNRCETRDEASEAEPEPIEVEVGEDVTGGFAFSWSGFLSGFSLSSNSIEILNRCESRDESGSAELEAVELEAGESVTGGWSFGSWTSLVSGFGLRSEGIDILNRSESRDVSAVDAPRRA